MDEYEKLIRQLEAEARERHDQFNWYWTGLAGATLTLLFNFISSGKNIHNSGTEILLREAIVFISCALIFAPLANLLGGVLTGWTSLSMRRKKDETIEEHNRRVALLYRNGKRLSFVRNCLALLSIGLYILGIVCIGIVMNALFLS